MIDNQVRFSLGELTYIGPTYEDVSTGGTLEAPKKTIACFRRILAGIREWQRRRAIMQEISMMTDRQLSDIGLSRSDLAYVFDATFAARPRLSEDYIDY